jgi:hypothetical protein
MSILARRESSTVFTKIVGMSKWFQIPVSSDSLVGLSLESMIVNLLEQGTNAHNPSMIGVSVAIILSCDLSPVRLSATWTSKQAWRRPSLEVKAHLPPLDNSDVRQTAEWFKQ